MSNSSLHLLKIAYGSMLEEAHDLNRKILAQSLDDLRPSGLIALLSSFPKENHSFILNTVKASEEALLSQYRQLVGTEESFTQALTYMADYEMSKLHKGESNYGTNCEPNESDCKPDCESDCESNQVTAPRLVEYEGMLVPLVPAHLLGLYCFVYQQVSKIASRFSSLYSSPACTEATYVFAEHVFRKSNFFGDEPVAVIGSDAQADFSLEAILHSDLLKVMSYFLAPENLVILHQSCKLIWQTLSQQSKTTPQRVVQHLLEAATELIIRQARKETFVDFLRSKDVFRLDLSCMALPTGLIGLEGYSPDNAARGWVRTQDLRQLITQYQLLAAQAAKTAKTAASLPELRDTLREILPLYQAAEQVRPTSSKKKNKLSAKPSTKPNSQPNSKTSSETSSKPTSQTSSQTNSNTPAQQPSPCLHPFVAAHCFAAETKLNSLLTDLSRVFSGRVFAGSKLITAGNLATLANLDAVPAEYFGDVGQAFADLKELAAAKDKISWALRRLHKRYSFEQVNFIEEVVGFWVEARKADNLAAYYGQFIEGEDAYLFTRLKNPNITIYRVVLACMASWDLFLLLLASLEPALRADSYIFHKLVSPLNQRPQVLPYLLVYLALAKPVDKSYKYLDFDKFLPLASETLEYALEHIPSYFQANESSSAQAESKASFVGLAKVLADTLELDFNLLLPQANVGDSESLCRPVAKFTQEQGTPIQVIFSLYLAQWLKPGILEALQDKCLLPAILHDCNLSVEELTAQVEQDAYQIRTNLAYAYLSCYSYFGDRRQLRLDLLGELIAHPDYVTMQIARFLLDLNDQKPDFYSGLGIGHKVKVLGYNWYYPYVIKHDLSKLLNPAPTLAEASLLQKLQQRQADGKKPTAAQEKQLVQFAAKRNKIIALTKQALDLASVPCSYFHKQTKQEQASQVTQANTEQELAVHQFLDKLGYGPFDHTKLTNLEAIPSLSLFSATSQDDLTPSSSLDPADNLSLSQASAAQDLNLDIYLQPIEVSAYYSGQADALNYTLEQQSQTSTRASSGKTTNTGKQASPSKTSAGAQKSAGNQTKLVLEGGAAGYQAYNFTHLDCEPHCRMVHQLAHPENLTAKLQEKLTQLGKLKLVDGKLVLSGKLSAANLQEIEFTDLLVSGVGDFDDLAVMPQRGSLEYLIAVQKLRPLMQKVFFRQYQVRKQGTKYQLEPSLDYVHPFSIKQKKYWQLRPTHDKLKDGPGRPKDPKFILERMLVWPALVVGDGIALTSLLHQYLQLKLDTDIFFINRHPVGFFAAGKHLVSPFANAPTLQATLDRSLSISTSNSKLGVFGYIHHKRVYNEYLIPALAESLKLKDNYSSQGFAASLIFPAQVQLVCFLAQGTTNQQKLAGVEILEELLERPWQHIAATKGPLRAFTQKTVLDLEYYKLKSNYKRFQLSFDYLSDGPYCIKFTDDDGKHSLAYLRLLAKLRELFVTEHKSISEKLDEFDESFKKIAGSDYQTYLSNS